MTQAQALDILKCGHNVFLTGPAGSGKTFLLNAYIKFLKRHNAAVGITASTGIAATHMNGMTIHSWAGIGVKDQLSNKDLRSIAKNNRLVKRFENTKVLIIDEISMLHHFRLDLVDRVCRQLKDSFQPFGGLQVVLCGDFFQLPPVARHGESAHFAHHSQIWKTMNLKVCYLDEQHRQSDDGLLRVLNDIRADETLAPLRARYKKEVNGGVNPTKLYTHNTDVDAINQKQLSGLPDKTHLYQMRSHGSQRIVETLRLSCLAPEELRLKIGAAVMFVKNNTEQGYVNGTLGIVSGFDENKIPIIQISNGRKITALPETWRIEEDGIVHAQLRQIPLRLAWAITVHKSRGMSLDAAEIDLSKSFVEGMGYVALSRLRALHGLKLMGLNKMALAVNAQVLTLDQELKKMSADTARELLALHPDELAARQKEFLRSIAPAEAEPRISTYEKTKALVEQKLSLQEIAKRRGKKVGTVLNHLETLIEEGEQVDIVHLRPEETRFNIIKTAFEQIGDTRLAPVRALLKDEFSYDELRLARLFLDKNP